MSDQQTTKKPEIGYPYLVIRYMATVYKRTAIEVRTGEAEVFIDRQQTCFVQYPEPFPEGETLGEECRTLLLNGVLEAVQRTRFRMCVVWASGSCTFVEIDGSFNDSEETPSGLSHIRSSKTTPK